MQIPKELQHFIHPTLIVISDFDQALIYRAHLEDAIEIARVKAPSAAFPNPDGSVGSGGGRFMNPSADVDQGADRGVFTKNVINTIKSLVEKHGIKHINLVVPTELGHRLEEKLPNNLKPMVTKTIEADLTYEPLVAVLKRLVELK